MKTYSHTPGPWAVGSNGATAKIVDADGKAVCMLTPRRDMWNGDLLAAAPDMLAALTEAVRVLDYAASVLEAPQQSHFRATIADARAAIAKATGGQP